jgi:cytochrome bd-type quinol oxidase subunit 2
MGETTARRVARWPLFLIAAPAAVAVWSGWVGLGQLSGFGIIHPLPGIWDSARLNTAITLPVGVEAYGAYALGAWLTPGASDRARKFARRSAIGSLGLGMAGHVIYHLLAAAHATRAPWPVVTLVSCLPVVALAFGAALAHLLHAEPDEAVEPETPPEVPAIETVADAPEPEPVPASEPCPRLSPIPPRTIPSR